MVKRACRYFAALVVLLATSGFALAAAARESPIKLQFILENNNSHHGFATNTAPVMQSVVIEMTGANLATDRDWPQVFVIKAGEKRDLGVVRGADPQVEYRFSTRMSYIGGSYLAPESSDPPFRLPYADGEAYLIGQAYGGALTSHRDPLVQQAVDFNMPEGTSVLAARDGVVADVVDSFTAGGTAAFYMDKANVVTVAHSDGTMAVYAHLFPHSVRVAVGQHVRAGEVLAKSGNTGFSSGPHLHFALTRPKLMADDRFELEALPVHFVTGAPARVLVPVQGLQATAESTRPANVRYRRIEAGRVIAQEPLPRVAMPTPERVPMQGDRPVVQAVPPASSKRADQPDLFEGMMREYGLWIAGGVSLLFLVGAHFSSRDKRGERYGDFE